MQYNSFQYGLFEEELGLLKTATNKTYNCHAESAHDIISHILSGKKAHGGVALLWKYSINDLITPLTNIQSDRIVEINCEMTGCRPLFILGVYLPSTNHTTEEYKKKILIFYGLCMNLYHLKDLNWDFGNALGNKGKKSPNDLGKILLDLQTF